MNPLNLYRYCWQLPMLAMLGLTLIPDLPLRHPVIGLWPLWLMVMPALALVRSRQLARHPAMALRVSQVLVFPAAPAGRAAARTEPRKAA